MHDGLERGGNLLRRSPRKKREREKERSGWRRQGNFSLNEARETTAAPQSVGTDWKEAAHSSAELDSKQSRERDRLLERRYTEE